MHPWISSAQLGNNQTFTVYILYHISSIKMTIQNVFCLTDLRRKDENKYSKISTWNAQLILIIEDKISV